MGSSLLDGDETNRKRGIMQTKLKWGLIVAAACLVFAGSALAGSHYLITSTNQISPNVFKQFQGKMN